MNDSGTPPPDSSAPEAGRSESLGAVLRRARERHELELSDVSEVTHVRREYLRALEEGDYGALPEDVYARNFLRLFAKTVSLDPAPLLDRFARERARHEGRSGSAPPSGARSAPSPTATRRSASPNAPSSATDGSGSGRLGEGPSRPRAPGAGLDLGRLASLLATLVLFAAVVAGAVWIFNANLFTTGRTPASPSAEPPTVATDAVDSAEPADAADEADAAHAGSVDDGPSTGLAAPVVPDTTSAAAAADAADGVNGSVDSAPLATAAPEILLTITTDPPGARVMVDNFVLPGRTPIVAERVTARPQRVISVSRDGYSTVEQTYDLSRDRSIDLVLSPIADAAAAAAADADVSDPAELAASQIELEVTGETWLEVYPSTARGEGQPLVYATVQAGERYVFSAPLFVRAGNAGGVRVRRGDGAVAPLGSTGEVIDRVFTP